MSSGGTFGYQNRILPGGTPLRIYGKEVGFVYWTDDVIIPMLIDMKRQALTGVPFSEDVSEQDRIRYGAVWMSLTPMEMLTQRGAIRAATGTVVIGGLGLGWLLRKVCEKETVERVIVVEKSQELLDWYGHAQCKKHDKVTDVICDDIYKQLGKHGADARYLLDIWPTFSGSRRDWRLAAAKRRLGKRLWAWGER